jgi:hypothetical protein
MNALRKQTDPTGRLDVAAVRTLEELLRVHFPNIRDAVFDGGELEGEIRLQAARVLGPRVPRLRVVRKAVKTVAPLMGAAMKDARRLKA